MVVYVCKSGMWWKTPSVRCKSWEIFDSTPLTMWKCQWCWQILWRLNSSLFSWRCWMRRNVWKLEHILVQTFTSDIDIEYWATWSNSHLLFELYFKPNSTGFLRLGNPGSCGILPKFLFLYLEKKQEKPLEFHSNHRNFFLQPQKKRS